jgi:hypothetical protein
VAGVRLSLGSERESRRFGVSGRILNEQIMGELVLVFDW